MDRPSPACRGIALACVLTGTRLPRSGASDRRPGEEGSWLCWGTHEDGAGPGARRRADGDGGARRGSGRSSAGARYFPSTTSGTRASTGSRWPRTPRPTSRRSGQRRPCTRTSAPHVGRRPDRHPATSPCRARQPRVPVTLRLRRRERPRPVPDPAGRADRGRPDARRRSPRARASTPARACSTSSSTRTRSAGGTLARGLRRDLRPELERAAARRLDVRRRGRPADPPGPRALRRGRGRARSTTRSASPPQTQQRASSGPARH